MEFEEDEQQLQPNIVVVAFCAVATLLTQKTCKALRARKNRSSKCQANAYGVEEKDIISLYIYIIFFKRFI